MQGKDIHPSTPIDLLRGHPSTSLLPVEPIRRAAQDILCAGSDYTERYSDSYGEDRHPLHYGPDLGNQHIRHEIGRWISEKYGIEEVVDGDRISLTNGASFALANTLQQLTSPSTGYTKRAFIISPTYFLACGIFQDAGFANLLTSIPYPTPTETSLASLVRKEIQNLEATTPNVPLKEGLKPISRGPGVAQKRIYRYVLYCVPTYSNPTGTTWDLQTRRELVELARERDILLISDDVYDFLAYSEEASTHPPPRLVTIDRELVLKGGAGNGKPGRDLDGYEDAGNTISNCSFSKLLGPGVRCGWVESATARLAAQLGRSGASRSGGCPSQLVSTLIYSLLCPDGGKAGQKGFSAESSRGIDRIIHDLSKAYTIRAKVFTEAIEKYLPVQTEIMGGQGGYFLWVGIGPADGEGKLNVREICKLALEGQGGKEGGTVVNKLVLAGGDLVECPGVSYDGSDNRMGFGDRWVRISVSWSDEKQGVEGIRRLGIAVERWKRGERPIQQELNKEDL